MTFDEIVGEVEDRLNLRSGTATARVGRLVNAVYRKVTSSIGLAAARPVFGLEATTSLGSAVVTFTGIEKIDRVTDETSGSLVVLTEISIDEMRMKEAGTGDPTEYAIQSMGRNSVTIRLNVLAQTAFTLKADGLETASTLSGSQVPAFSESYHDVLVEGVLKDEYLKLEKPTLAKVAKDTYEGRLSELRLFIAKGKLKIRPGDRTASESFGSGGGGSVGGVSYEQTGLITFDRAGTGVAPFAVAADNNGVVANLNADLLDGLEAAAFALAANLADYAALAGTNVFTGSNTFPNTGLKVLDTDASHALSIVPGSDLTAARTLTITTGDAARTLTLIGNPTLADWFDQSVKVAASPTFAGLTLSGLLTVSGFGSNDFSAGGTGTQAIGVRNTTAGTGNSALIRVGNDATSSVIEFRATSTTYTAAGTIPQDGANINVSRAGGLNLSAEHASGAIRFYTGGSTLRGTIGTDGVVSWASFGAHAFSAGGTGAQEFGVRNTTAGTGNTSRLAIGNDADIRNLFAESYSSTFSSAGRKQASGALIEAQGAGGLSIAASQAAGVVRLYSGGTTERWQLDASGNLVQQAGGGQRYLQLFSSSGPKLIASVSSSVANNGTFVPFVGSPVGFLFIQASDNSQALFVVNTVATFEISDVGTVYTNTQGTGSSYNVYLTGGELTVENKSGAARTFKCQLIQFS